MLSQEYQINNLNILVKIKLAPSKIHGIGVFAMRDMSDGAKLHLDRVPEVYQISDLTKLLPDVRKLLVDRWPQIINGEKFVYPTDRLLNYLNHSDKPNYDFVKDETLEPVYKGEEILIDYRKFKDYKKVYTWLAKKKVV